MAHTSLLYAKAGTGCGWEARRKGKGLLPVGSVGSSSFTSFLDVPASTSLLGHSEDPSQATAFLVKSPVPFQIPRASPHPKIGHGGRCSGGLTEDSSRITEETSVGLTD